MNEKVWVLTCERMMRVIRTRAAEKIDESASFEEGGAAAFESPSRYSQRTKPGRTGDIGIGVGGRVVTARGRCVEARRGIIAVREGASRCSVE